MNRKLYILPYLLICFISLIGCTNNSNSIDSFNILNPQHNDHSTSILDNSDVEDFTINVWSYNFTPESIAEKFELLFPKAQINIVFLDSMDYIKVINALASNNSPDIIIYSLDYIGKFNSITGFEDLSQSEYNFDSISSKFNSVDLQQCSSIDGKNLIAIPFTQGSTITYYRTDIFENLSLPITPEEVAQLMSTADGWLSMAKTLKENNIYALQWKDDIIKIVLNSFGIFNEDMSLNIYNNKLKEALKISSEAYSEGLIGKYDIWSDQGKKAVQDGEIAMVYLNKWGENYLNSIAPNTSGKWAATTLPLNLYSSQNTNVASISSSSKYKSQCWDLIKTLIIDESNHYNSLLSEESEFLNNQKANLLYEDVSKKLPYKFHTQLDDAVYSLILDNVNGNTEKIQNIDSFILYLESKIISSIGYEHQILSDSLK